jgi:outer membrane protein W
MKNVFLCFAITLVCSSVVHAQLEKGAKIVGGDMVFLYSPGEQSTIYGSVNPYLEYFIVDNLAVGGTGSLSYRVSEDAQGLNSNFTHISFYPSVRYFVFTSEKFKPFVHVGVGYYYGISRFERSGQEMQTFKSDGLSATTGIGATHLIVEDVGLVGSLNYIRYFPRGAYQGGSQFNLGFGFQIFIP